MKVTVKYFFANDVHYFELCDLSKAQKLAETMLSASTFAVSESAVVEWHEDGFAYRLHMKKEDSDDKK